MRAFLNDRAEEDGLSKVADLNIINGKAVTGSTTHGYLTFRNIFENLRVVETLRKNGKVFNGYRIHFGPKPINIIGVVTPEEIKYLEAFKKKNQSSESEVSDEEFQAIK